MRRPALDSQLELRCFVDDIRVRTSIRSKMLLAIKSAFDEAGIALAQPKVTRRPPAGSAADAIAAVD